MKDFTKKYGPWAIVTGATSGTGLHFANMLAAKGINLILVSRGEKALLSTQKLIMDRYQIQVIILKADLSDPHSINEIERVTQSLDVGLLINNAGYSITGEFSEQNWTDQRRLLDTILNTPLALTHAFANRLIKRGGGGIILVSSSVAYTPTPLWSVYSAGKAGLLSFGESISQELKKHHIDVLTVCPGALNTKFQRESGIHSPGLMDPEKVAAVTLRSLGKKTAILPGVINKMLFLWLGRVLPGKIRLPLFEKMMNKIQVVEKG